MHDDCRDCSRSSTGREYLFTKRITTLLRTLFVVIPVGQPAGDFKPPVRFAFVTIYRHLHWLQGATFHFVLLLEVGALVVYTGNRLGVHVGGHNQAATANGSSEGGWP